MAEDNATKAPFSRNNSGRIFSEMLLEDVKLMPDKVVKVSCWYLPSFFSYRENTRVGVYPSTPPPSCAARVNVRQSTILPMGCRVLAFNMRMCMYIYVVTCCWRLVDQIIDTIAASLRHIRHNCNIPSLSQSSTNSPSRSKTNQHRLYGIHHSMCLKLSQCDHL